MRLIDADAFENYVFNEWQINEISNGDWIQFREWLKNQNTIVEFDGEINKVIVRGEEYQKLDSKTGRWEQVEVSYLADMDAEIKESMAIASMFCPKCKRYHNEVYLYGNPTYGVNYCPNCGAKMEVSE